MAEERNGQGRTTSTYVEQMREDARKQLRTSESGLAGQAEAAALIEQVRTGSPDAAALRQAHEALEPLEGSLESA